MPTAQQPTSKFLTVNGLRLHYLEWGGSDAPPIVCVHGYTSSAEAFNAPSRHFQDRFHILAPDVRGHGESAWSPAGAYQYTDQVGDLVALVDQLGLPPFVLIGTSMGGIIAMTYAVERADRLRGLVINDIGPDPEPGSQRITGLVGSRPASFASLDAAMSYRRHVSPIVAGRSLEDQRELALGVLRQRPDGSWGWKIDPAYIEQRVARGAPPRPLLWPGLATLPIPTLVVWGTDSDILSEAQATRMVETLPRGELAAIRNVGHAPTLTEPASLAAIERFFDAL